MIDLKRREGKTIGLKGPPFPKEMVKNDRPG